jgi:hypothetical protein
LHPIKKDHISDIAPIDSSLCAKPITRNEVIVAVENQKTTLELVWLFRPYHQIKMVSTDHWTITVKETYTTGVLPN